MPSDTIRRSMFQSDKSAFAVIGLEQVLEDIVQAGLRLRTEKHISQKRLDQELEEKAIQVLKRIFEALAPNAFQNVRTMDKRVIWRFYWKMQNGPQGPTTSIFWVLYELDQNNRLLQLISENA